MTNYERDQYNNEAYEDIRGMGWVPSLNEYGSRASVAESLPAKSKKEVHRSSWNVFCFVHKEFHSTTYYL